MITIITMFIVATVFLIIVFLRSSFFIITILILIASVVILHRSEVAQIWPLATEAWGLRERARSMD